MSVILTYSTVINLCVIKLLNDKINICECPILLGNVENFIYGHLVQAAPNYLSKVRTFCFFSLHRQNCKVQKKIDNYDVLRKY